MWSDNETDRDFLNFSGVTDTVAEIIVQADGNPISIGVSGQWGVGKSSMIKLIKKSLEVRNGGEANLYIFVEFNAWLYQGYDDARAALIEVIATTLEKEASKQKKAIDKAKNLLERVNWLRVAKFGVGVAATGFGIPMLGFIKEALSGEGADFSLLKSKSPPKEIQDIRDLYQEILTELDTTLVVLIDDLDRCLPETTISTLEAIRLFLFLEHTAFVIAADDKMIKTAVKKHFDDIDEDLVTNYFDKLIQIPIRVPALGTQEVRAYLLLLYVENSELSDTDKETARSKVCEQLSNSWQGERVDKKFLESLSINFDDATKSNFDTAERLAHIMTTASNIKGNPRLIKRFLNALSIRMSISRAHGVGVDEAVLAKLLLFERCGNPEAYEELRKAVNDDNDGKPHLLEEWEKKVNAGEEIILESPWDDDDFITEWLTIPPTLSDKDLRGALYVSRDHSPLITPEDRLSSEAVELLAALLTQPSQSNSLSDRLKILTSTDLTIMMDRVLDKSSTGTEMGNTRNTRSMLSLVKTRQK